MARLSAVTKKRPFSRRDRHTRRFCGFRMGFSVLLGECLAGTT